MKLAFATPFVIWHCALQTHFSSVLVTVALKQGRESRTTPPSHPRLAIAQRGYMKLAFVTPFVIWHCAFQTHFSSVLVTVALKQGRESRTTP
jgi:hypothetical protein